MYDFTMLSHGDGVVAGVLSFVNTDERQDFFMGSKGGKVGSDKAGYFPEDADRKRANWNAYMRQYRAAHPDKTREWRENYIMRKAARLAAERGAATGGGGDNAGA